MICADKGAGVTGIDGWVGGSESMRMEGSGNLFSYEGWG